jgi:hypothetical protein
MLDIWLSSMQKRIPQGEFPHVNKVCQQLAIREKIGTEITKKKGLSYKQRAVEIEESKEHKEPQLLFSQNGKDCRLSIVDCRLDC